MSFFMFVLLSLFSGSKRDLRGEEPRRWTCDRRDELDAEHVGELAGLLVANVVAAACCAAERELDTTPIRERLGHVRAHLVRAGLDVRSEVERHVAEMQG